MEQLQASLQAVSDQKVQLEEDLQRQAEMVRRSVRTVGWTLLLNNLVVALPLTPFLLCG